MSSPSLPGILVYVRMNVEPLPTGLLPGLRQAAAYPDDPDASSGVQEIQTHISHVFLTRTRVYKLRKAVDLGFVAFGRRAERNADCEREVRLNRRFAPDVYLGIAPVRSRAGRVRLGPLAEQLAPADASGERPEHCVVMRRLPEGRDALSLLERGELRGRHVDAMAESIARFHQANRLGTPAPFETREWLTRQADPVEANFAVLEKAVGQSVSGTTLARVIDAARATLRDRQACFERRRRAGLAVDGHWLLYVDALARCPADARFRLNPAPLGERCAGTRGNLHRVLPPFEDVIRKPRAHDTRMLAQIVHSVCVGEPHVWKPSDSA